MKLINVFLKSLEDEGVRYVHWKNNTFIDEALLGDDDLDLLIDISQKELLFYIFKKFNIFRGVSYEDNWNNSITHHYGIDIDSNKLFHIHLHFNIEIAFDYDLCYRLPIVREYLKERIKYKQLIYIPNYENEYILLVIRLILKNSLTPFLLHLPNRQYSLIKNSKKTGVVHGSGYHEFVDLKAKINDKKLKETLAVNYKFLDREVFKFCENTLNENNNLVSFFKAGKKLEKDLENCRDYGEFTSFRKALVRLYSIRFYMLLKKLKIYKKPMGKKPENGGRIIAFVGGDGAGKSTTILNLKNTLKRQFAVKIIHVGKPSSCLQGFSLKLASKFLSILRFSNLSKALLYISIAINRKKEFKKACKLRDKGFIVLQDRIPLEGITAMDCPRVHTLLEGKYKKLSQFEKRQYQNIKGVDLLFLMKLDPEIAIKRRPNDDPDELMIRSGQIWNNEWRAPYAFEINTGENNLEEVQKIVLKEVWKNFNKPFVRTEVIGLNGTGKTTLLKKLERTLPNIQKNINIKKYPAIVFKSLLINIIGCINIYIKTRKFYLIRIYFHYKTSLLIIQKWKRKNCTPCKNLVFDQGPIFQLVILHKEKCISTNNLELDLVELHSLLNKVIYLSAPLNILYDRVLNRENSNGRGQYMDIDTFTLFCEDYLKSYNMVLESGLTIKDIRTEKRTIQEIENTFNELVCE
jgi:thymidylate kinase